MMAAVSSLTGWMSCRVARARGVTCRMSCLAGRVSCGVPRRVSRLPVRLRLARMMVTVDVAMMSFVAAPETPSLTGIATEVFG